MRSNVGFIDSAVRIVIGALMVGSAATGLIGPWGYLGVVPLVTGLFHRCPAYRIFGFDTCRTKVAK